MITYQAHLPDALHASFKASIRNGYAKLTLQEGFELAVLTLLAVQGEVDPVALGVGEKVRLVFNAVVGGGQ